MSSIKQKSNDNTLNYSEYASSDTVSSMIAEYRPLVETIAMRYISSPFDKDDLVQEGMIGLLAAVKSFDSSKGASFKTYACVCIDNAIQSSLRKINRKKDIPTDAVVPYEEKYITELGVVISAEDSFLADETVNKFSNYIYEKLSVFENEVLKLHVSGCSYDEIAKRLNKDVKSIDNALQRIRKKLNGFF